MTQAHSPYSIFALERFMAITTLFFDRDGTLIEDCHYLSDPNGVTLLPQVKRALQEIAKAGIRIFVVTNQSGIGRGYFSIDDYKACEARLDALLAPSNVTITATAFCPHAPDEECTCRKPDVGMWETLSHTYNLKAEECAMVGDDGRC